MDWLLAGWIESVRGDARGAPRQDPTRASICRGTPTNEEHVREAGRCLRSRDWLGIRIDRLVGVDGTKC